MKKIMCAFLPAVLAAHPSLSHEKTAPAPERPSPDLQVRWMQTGRRFAEPASVLCVQPLVAQVLLKGMPKGVHHVRALWRKPNGVVYRHAAQFFNGERTARAAFALTFEEPEMERLDAYVFRDEAEFAQLTGFWTLEIQVDGVPRVRREFHVTCQ